MKKEYLTPSWEMIVFDEEILTDGVTGSGGGFSDVEIENPDEW